MITLSPFFTILKINLRFYKYDFHYILLYVCIDFLIHDYIFYLISKNMLTTRVH